MRTPARFGQAHHEAHDPFQVDDEAAVPWGAMGRVKHGACALCGRVTTLTFHHLIPRKMHRRPRFRKRHDRDELNRGIDICARCHRGLHRLHDEMTLASRLNTLEALRDDEAVARHVSWVARQKS